MIFNTQVDKECTKSVHPMLVYFNFLLHSVNMPEKSVKEVSHSSTLLYLQCKTSADKWQTSGHFWSTWVVITEKHTNCSM